MPSMRLPDSWVESLFGKFAALYGDAFARKWEGVPRSDLIEQWADALGPYADDAGYRGMRIRWALTQLRDHNPYPPSLPEFVSLVRQAPRPEPVALPAPKVPPDVARQRADEIAKTAKKIAGQPRDMLDWAKSASTAHETNGRKGSAWESAIVKTAQSGDERFVRILREHIAAGVIRSQQAIDALSTLEASS